MSEDSLARPGGQPNTEDLRRFGSLVVRVLSEGELTQKDAATILNISEATVSRLCSGKRVQVLRKANLDELLARAGAPQDLSQEVHRLFAQLYPAEVLEIDRNGMAKKRKKIIALTALVVLVVAAGTTLVAWGSSDDSPENTEAVTRTAAGHATFNRDKEQFVVYDDDADNLGVFIRVKYNGVNLTERNSNGKTGSPSGKDNDGPPTKPVSFTLDDFDADADAVEFQVCSGDHGELLADTCGRWVTDHPR